MDPKVGALDMFPKDGSSPDAVEPKVDPNPVGPPAIGELPPKVLRPPPKAGVPPNAGAPPKTGAPPKVDEAPEPDPKPEAPKA
jgi:hypothetical protein